MLSEIAGIAAVLGGIALFALPGLALTRLFPRLRDLSLPRRLAYGYLLGIAAVAGGLYVLSFLFGVPIRPPAIFTLAALPLVLFFRPRRDVMPGRPRRFRRRSWLSLATLTAGAVAAFVSLGVLAEAVANPLQDWDGRMTWTTQARYVRAAGGVLPPAMVEPRWYVSLPHYPLLLPVAQTAVMEAFRAEPDRQLFRGLYAAFFPVLLLVVYDGARRWAGAGAAALTALAACGLPVLSFGMDGGAAGAYSDLPLACFYGAALVLLLSPAARAVDGVAAGLLLGAAVLTKSEGMILAAAALLAAALFQALRGRGSRRRAWAPLATAAALAALACGLLAGWRAAIPNREDEEYGRLLATVGLWPNVIARAPRLLPGIVFRMSRWGALAGLLGRGAAGAPGGLPRSAAAGRAPSPARLRRAARRGLDRLLGPREPAGAAARHLEPLSDPGLGPAPPAARPGATGPPAAVGDRARRNWHGTC